MAINQILGVPDWQKLSTYTGSNPAVGFSQIYPGPNKYWYAYDGTYVKRFEYGIQYGAGLSTIFAATESFVDKRIDVNIGSGLSYSYEGEGSEIFVTGLTSGNLNILGSFTQGYVLSLSSTASGQFQWIAAGSASVQGTSGSIAKFTSGSSVGDSGMNEVITGTPSFDRRSVYIGMPQPTNLGGSSTVRSSVAFGASPSILVDKQIFLGDNPNRYIGFTNSDQVEISTTGEFIVADYPLFTGTTSKARFIGAVTDTSTFSNLGYDRNIDFLSGLVSVNQRPGYPALFVNTTSPDLVGVSPSNMVRTPRVVFTQSNAFLGTITGTFGVALGLSGGGIQIKDGSEGQYRVLVSSTTQGHGVWATMVGIQGLHSLTSSLSGENLNGNFLSSNYVARVPIYQKPGSFELGDRFYGPTSAWGTFSRSFTYSILISEQNFAYERNWDGVTRSGHFDVNFIVPNIGATYAQFMMNRSNQEYYGSLYLYDEGEKFGVVRAGGLNTRTGIFAKDISNTVLGPGSNGSYAIKPGNRNNSIVYFLNSDRTSAVDPTNKLTIQAWNFQLSTGLAARGFTFSNTNFTIDTGSYPGYIYWPRSVYEEKLIWASPTDWQTGLTISATQGQPDRFSSVTSLGGGLLPPLPRTFAINPNNGLDTQVVRRRTNLLYNQPERDRFNNILYNFEVSRMGYTASLTQSSTSLDTILGQWIRIESGDFNGSMTQSTGLFVTPQWGSFVNSGVLGMTLSRQVGIQVTQQVGYTERVPLGTVREAYDFMSGRIGNGNVISNIQSHVGFFAQSKMRGRQWDPSGRRTFDYGGRLDNTVTFRTTPTQWPTYSVYKDKPWAFYAERDKSNLGGGLLIDMGATFGTPLRAFLEIEAVTRSVADGTSPFTVSAAVSVFQRDGSYVTFSYAGTPYSTFVETYPQVLLRPGVTPSYQTDGSLWYTPGFLAFVDGGQVFNLLGTKSAASLSSGLTGNGVLGYVPVWTGNSSLRGTSSIYISDNGGGNVAINFNGSYPNLPLQIATSSTMSLVANGVTSSLWNVAVGISGSILYQDGSHGVTGSVMMADSTGKTYLFQLVDPKANQITFGNDGSNALTSTSSFKFWPSGGSLLVSVGNTSVLGNTTGSNIIIGGFSHSICTNATASVIMGGVCHTIGTSSRSVIIGGGSSSIVSVALNSSIIGGSNNFMGSGSTNPGLEILNSAILGGCRNIIGTCSSHSVIIGGRDNRINRWVSSSSIISSQGSKIDSSLNTGQNDAQGFTIRSLIAGGNNNIICRTRESAIIGGADNKISHLGPNGNYVYNSLILGGKLSSIETYACETAIVGGGCNCIACRTCGSVILGGCCNKICLQNWNIGTIGNNNSAIIAGLSNSVENWRNNGHCMSTIIGGNLNRMGCVLNLSSYFSGNCRSSIVSGYNNAMVCGSNDSLILGGRNNLLNNNSCESAIIGGEGASMSLSCNSLILGGVGLTLSGCNNMVYVPSLMINSAANDAAATCFLVWDPIRKIVKSRSGGGGGVGPEGPAGADGLPGANGATGPTGFQGSTGPRGATGVGSLGPFTQSNFFPYGATFALNGMLAMGAASTQSPGLVSTGSQTFSGDKFFFGDIFMGPTNTTGVFLYDGGGKTYSGFVGPTALPNNIIYRLPPTASLERYLKTCTTDGTTWGLMWATAAGSGGGGALPNAQIGFGNSTGTSITSDTDFTFNSVTCDFIVSSTPTNTTSKNNNAIVGGSSNKLYKGGKSALLGGSGNRICQSYNSVILGGENNYIRRPNIIDPTYNTYYERNSAIVGGQCHCIMHGTNFDYPSGAFIRGGASIVGGACHTICKDAAYSSILGGYLNTLFDQVQGSAILAGVNNIVSTQSSFSTIIGGAGNRIRQSACSAIIGGNALSLNNCPGMVFVPQLMINNVVQSDTQTRVLVWNSTDKTVRWRASNTFGGGPGPGASAPANEVTFGTPDGLSLTSTPSFKFWCCGQSLLAASSSNIQSWSGSNAIISGFGHTISNATSSVILGGSCNILVNDVSSTIIGGCCNTMTFSSSGSIISGNCSRLYASNNSSIVGGYRNIISSSSSIIGKVAACAVGSFPGSVGTKCSQIIGGVSNRISTNGSYFIPSNVVNGVTTNVERWSYTAEQSTILGGENNLISRSRQARILGSFCSSITDGSNGSAIFGGCCNIIATFSRNNSILGGLCNKIGGGFGAATYQIQGQGNFNSLIVGGLRNCISGGFYSDQNSIFGGVQNCIGRLSFNDTIIRSQTSRIESTGGNRIILGSLDSGIWADGIIRGNDGNNIRNTIAFGTNNKINQKYGDKFGPDNLILGGDDNKIGLNKGTTLGFESGPVCSSMILFGKYNRVDCSSYHTSILASKGAHISTTENSSIVSSAHALICNSVGSVILGAAGFNPKLPTGQIDPITGRSCFLMALGGGGGSPTIRQLAKIVEVAVPLGGNTIQFCSGNTPQNQNTTACALTGNLGLSVGMEVFGCGIPDNTTITNLNVDNKTITLSRNVCSPISDKTEIHFLLRKEDQFICSSNNSLLLGGITSSIYLSNCSGVLVSNCGGVTASSNSTMVGGVNNLISSSLGSIVVGGGTNSICVSRNSTIISSQNSGITSSSFGSMILNGVNGDICNSSINSMIVGGATNSICSSRFSSLISSQCSGITNSNTSMVVGGCRNNICSSSNSTVIGGCFNTVQFSSLNSTIIGGVCHIMSTSSCRSSMIGGYCNTVQFGSYDSTIVGGMCNNMSSCIDNSLARIRRSAILSGHCNSMICSSCESAIIAGCGSSMSNSCNSVIIGGQGLTMSSICNTVYLPSLMLFTASQSPSPTASHTLVWNPDTKRVNSIPNPFSLTPNFGESSLTYSFYGSILPGYASQSTAGNQIGTTQSPWKQINAFRIHTKELYVGPASIYLGELKLSEQAGRLQIEDLTVGSTASPIIIGSGTGPQGFTGPQGAPSVVNLIVALDPSTSSLTVTHSFGNYPLVQAVDGSGYTIQSSSYSILHSSTNSYTITFNGTYSGYVITGGGLTGPQGSQGTQGVQGRTGPQGSVGPQGVQGTTGSQGVQGVTGPRGFTGNQGFTGPTGVQGNTGAVGLQGPTGPAGGPQGFQGPQGDQGPRGFDGTQGPSGDVGPQGITGPQGDQGYQGPSGPAGGPQGVTGVQGNTGPQGVTGPYGPGGSAQLYGNQFSPFTIYSSPSSPTPSSNGEIFMELNGTASVGVTGSLKIYQTDNNGHLLNHYWDTLLNSSQTNFDNILYLTGYYNFSLNVTYAEYSSDFYKFDISIISTNTNPNQSSDPTETVFYQLSAPSTYLSRNDSVSGVTVTVITHSSNRYPIVQTIDNTGQVIIPNSVEHLSTQAFRIVFSSTFSGTIITGGAAGPQGHQGVTGTSGTNGVTGSQGITGPQGNTGAQGITGPQGPATDPIIPSQQVVFGIGTGLSSSSNFTFEKTNSLISVGTSNNIFSSNLNSAIIGGNTNDILANACNSVIIGGSTNQILESNHSTIIGGCVNSIHYSSCLNSIVGGGYNTICSYITRSLILGGLNNVISYCSNNSTIVGGYSNCIVSDDTNPNSDSTILGGRENKITNATQSSFSNFIIGGNCNCLSFNSHSGIIGGCNNTLTSSTNSVIIGGQGLSFNNKTNTVILPSLTIASSSVSRSHINLIAGASPSVPVDGDLWYDGSNLYFRKGGTTVQLT